MQPLVKKNFWKIFQIILEFIPDKMAKYTVLDFDYIPQSWRYHMDRSYELMDWAGVEAIVDSEEDQPQNLLGAHVTEDGITIQGFFPGAREVAVRVNAGKKGYPMDLEDEAGYFAVLIPGKRIPDYVSCGV